MSLGGVSSTSQSRPHYGDKDGLRVLSYGGVITAVLSNRTYGKTWTFKRRAFRRAMKRGKKTIWLRLFEKEKKQCVDTFYTSANLQKYCGVVPYDAKTKKGNLKQRGSTFYYRRNERSPWRWFLKVFALNDADAVRSADDVDVDFIVFDEFTKPPHKYRRFQGDIADAFNDILFSSKREHIVRCVLLGNKESYNNPIFSYFGIKPLPVDFEGIRTYRKGSFVVQQINNKPPDETDYDHQIKNLFNGTRYGRYIYESQYKTASGLKPRKTPATATLYVQLSINSIPLKISSQNGYYYVNERIDKTKRVYCDVLPHKYPNELLLVKRQKQFFISFINALADNRVYFDDEATYEAILPFLQWLGV